MMQVLGAGDIQAVPFSIEMEIALTMSEMFHIENGVMAGSIPMDVVHNVMLLRDKLLACTTYLASSPELL
jgi:hypothetical protein